MKPGQVNVLKVAPGVLQDAGQSAAIFFYLGVVVEQVGAESIGWRPQRARSCAVTILVTVILSVEPAFHIAIAPRSVEAYSGGQSVLYQWNIDSAP